MFERLFKSFRKEPDAPEPDLVALQNAIVRGVAHDRMDLHDYDEWGDREWVHIAVNHEVLVEDGRRSSTETGVLAHEPGKPLEDLSFRLSAKTKLDFLALRDAMAEIGGQSWTIADLTIDRDGSYDFSFSYDAPPRLNGDLMHQTLKGLLDRYKAANNLD